MQQRLRIPAVMVTHDQDEALAMADRVILMREGRIEQASTPTRLYARPASEYAARFVGRINLWPAEVLAPNEVLVGRTPILLDHRVPAGTRRVMLGIRPEQVRIESFDFTLARTPQATLPADCHTGVVLETTFCGAYMSLRVEVPFLLTLLGALRQLDREFEVVAESMGVPFWKTLWRVYLPVCLPALLEVAGFFFVNAMTTVSAVVFLYAPHTQLASVAVLNMDDAGDVAPAAAMAVLIFATAGATRMLFGVTTHWVSTRTQRWRIR